jgi:hypothetical protein
MKYVQRKEVFEYLFGHAPEELSADDLRAVRLRLLPAVDVYVPDVNLTKESIESSLMEYETRLENSEPVWATTPNGHAVWISAPPVATRVRTDD